MDTLENTLNFLREKIDPEKTYVAGVYTDEPLPTDMSEQEGSSIQFFPLMMTGKHILSAIVEDVNSPEYTIMKGVLELDVLKWFEIKEVE